MLYKSYKIQKCSKENLKRFNEFVLIQNHLYYNSASSVNNYTNLLDSIYSFELMFYYNSKFFIATDDNNEIVGTIRSLLWDNYTQLPIQTFFGVNILAYFNGEKNLKLWHIGRFAIAKRINSISLLKALILKAISPIVQHESLGAVAECDEKLLKILKLLGVEATIVAPAKKYLGSNTFPVFFSYQNLYKFYIKNTLHN